MYKHFSGKNDVPSDPKLAALQMREVTVSYATEMGRSTPIDGLTLSVEAGEVRGLVGESGSGKSTAARAIAGLLGRWGRVEAGSIQLSGFDVSSLSERDRARRARAGLVSIIFQDPLNALDPVRTIQSQISEALRLRNAEAGSNKRAKRQTIADLLDRVQIRDPYDVMTKYPHELSGGMRQRVVIGMAIIGPPKLLIADEATTALDVVTQDSLVKLIRGLADEFHMAVLFITHNLALASEICDTVAVMYGGKVVESGACKTVVTRPVHPYTKGLIKAVPRLRGAWEPVVGIRGTPYTGAGKWLGCAFVERCSLSRGRQECHNVVPGFERISRADGVQEVRCHFAIESDRER